MKTEPKDLSGTFLEHEKSAMREELRAFARSHPARAPLSLRFQDSLQRMVYSPGIQFAAATLGLLLVTGSGTAFAAQDALPGDALYGIKVHIEEPIVGAFATSPQAKADWSAQLTARRLAEAERLAIQNKLTPATATAIRVGLDQATQNFDASVAELASSTDNAATVATLASNMEATIAANAQVMDEIAHAVPASAPTLQPLLASMHERATALGTARVAMDDTAVEGNADQARMAAHSALVAAQAQMNDIAAHTQGTPISASNPASSQVQEAQQDLTSGQQNLANGDYGTALQNLQAAIVSAHAARLNLSIRKELEESAGVRLPSASTSVPFTVSPETAAPSSATSSPDLAPTPMDQPEDGHGSRIDL